MPPAAGQNSSLTTLLAKEGWTTALKTLWGSRIPQEENDHDNS